MYPEQFIPGESQHYGEIRNSWKPFCLDSGGDELGKAIIGYGCHGQGGNQYWMLSKHGEIRRDEHCFDYAQGKSGIGKPDKIFTYNCHSSGGNQFWEMTENGQIKHDSGLCIEMDESRVKIHMQICNANEPKQIWKWKKRASGDRSHPTLPPRE